MLSSSQQRLWILSNLYPDSAAYNLPAALRLEGPLDTAVLRQSLQKVVNRHDVLRMGIRPDRPEPFLVAEPEVDLPVIDVMSDADIERIATAEASRPFDLAAPPLLRAMVLRKGPDHHVLVMNLHHIIADGVSVQILVRELGAFYQSVTTGAEVALPPLPIDYSDYASWQRHRLADGELQAELEYWKAQLAGSPPVLELPPDRARPAFPVGHGAALTLRLPPSTIAAVRSYGKNSGVTPFMTMLAAFKALLYRYTGTEDIVLGSTIAARVVPELENIVGLFANTILLRTSLHGNPSFAELVERVRETVIGALAHQELAFDSIVDALRPERGSMRTPFFGVLFDFQEAPLQKLRLGALAFSPLDLHNGTTKFDLTVQVFDLPGELIVNFEYATELFDQSSIERFVASYQRLLDSVTSSPDDKLGAPRSAALSAAAAVPDHPESSSAPEDDAPRTPLERELVDIWGRLLHISDAKIGVYDGFFALGGQSLLAIELLTLINERFGCKLTLRMLFEDATIAGLAERIESRATSEGALPELQRVPVQQSYELAPYQLPEWYMHELAPTSPLYNVCVGNVVLTGDLDRSVFATTWQDLIARHAAFRTCIINEGGLPRIQIRETVKLDPAEVFIDRTALPEEQVPAEMARFAWQTSNILLDFERGPLFRVQLVEYSGKRFQLILLTHHIIWDERSMMNIGYEMQELYNAHRSRRAPRLPVLELEYVDFARWINACIKAGSLDKQRRYWLDTFATVPEPLDLPFDFPRPALQTFNGTEILGLIDAAGMARINAFLHKRDTTLYMLTFATLSLLIHRLTGSTDFVIGTPIANRNDKRLAPLIGLFATAMPMRCRIAEGMTFADLLTSVRDVSLAAYDNHVYPSILAIQEINPKMDASRTRLFSVMMGVQNNKAQIMTDLHFDGLELSYADGITLAEQETSRFDLTVIIDELVDRTEVRFNFNTDLFKHETVRRMQRQFLSLLAQVMAEPSYILSEYVLDTPEQRAIQAGFNQTSRRVRLDREVHELFEEAALRYPDRTAIEDGHQALTYCRLEQRANRLAHRLKARGVAAGDRVAIRVERSIEVVAAVLALLKLGAAYVPIATETPEARVQSIVAAARVSHVLARADLVDDFDWPNAPPVRPRSPRGLAYVMFTSGTTGEPNGIEIEHRGLVNLIDWLQERYALTADDAALCVTSLAFDASVLEVFWPLGCGARIVLAPLESERNPGRIAAAVDQSRVTFLQTVPIMLDELVHARRRGEISDLPSLRLVICGGASLSRQQRDGFRTEFSCQLANHYGPTEVTVDATSFDCAQDFDGEMVPIGSPVGNARVYVLSPDLKEVPLGATGEIYVSSPGLARGYAGDPRRTAERFLPDPFSDQPGVQMYRTGDVGRISNEGVLYFGGRIDRQVKVRGNRVELAEIEVRLAEHPDIEHCAVRFIAERIVGFAALKAERHSLKAGNLNYRLFTLAQRPDLRRAMDLLHVDAWPEYFAGDCVLRNHWLRLVTELPHQQLLLVADDGQLAAVGNAIAIQWTGRIEDLSEGWDACLVQGLDASVGKRNTLVGLAIVVGREGHGLGTLMLEALRRVARGAGFERLIIPVRPTEKPAHRDVDVEAYSRLQRADGLPQDRWLRIHQRAGGKILCAAPRSQHIVATVSDWERWAQRKFSASGEYTVTGGLQPLSIDLASDRGEYWDPAIWVEHTLPADSSWVHLDVAHLRTFLARSLPTYMVPDTIRFVGALPLTANGKIDEQALRALAQGQGARRAEVPPHGPVQTALAEIWSSVLAIERMGVHDDFFDLGGHSIAAVRMLVMLDEQLKVHVTLRDLFANPTIAALDHLISQRQQEAA